MDFFIVSFLMFAFFVCLVVGVVIGAVWGSKHASTVERWSSAFRKKEQK